MKQSKLNKISDYFGGPIDCKQSLLRVRRECCGIPIFLTSGAGG